MTKTVLAACLAGCATLGTQTAVHAQSPWLTGYVQTVPLYTGATGLLEGTGSSFNRFRVTTEPAFGAFSVEASYEHAVTFRQAQRLGGAGVGAVPSGGEWLTLQSTIVEEEHVLWEHRLDRLHVDWRPSGVVELSAGRQAVSWGTTLFLTPADPFLPFSPTDPFREFRAGVDAARLRISPTPLSEIDVVVRPTRTAVGEETTALVRGLVTVQNWEISGWGGTLYGDTAGAAATAGAIGAWAIRGEAVVRDIDNEVSFRGTVGVDRLLQLNGRDFYFLAEYQHDGLGAARPDDYLALLLSDPFLRGEFQVVGRDETVLQASYQVHPLWGLSGLWLWNMNDGSSLVSPTVSYSLSDEAAILGGALLGFGDDQITPVLPLPSEYGRVGVTAYLSASWFF